MVRDRADLAFVHAAVTTMDAAGTSADALAVRDGRVVALGDQAVRDHIGPRTEIIDLHGRPLLPGFQDAHVHPVYGGIERLRCDLSESSDVRDCLHRIAEHSRTHPRRWILGGGWESGLFPGGSPTAEALDAVTGDRPAYLVNQDHHDAWVNTAALRLAGIDASSPDPPDGRIARYPNGQPSGTLHEGATGLVARLLPPTEEHEYREALLEAQRHLHSRGVTAWRDAIVGPYLGYDDLLPVYLDLDRRGELLSRVRGSLWWDRTRGAEQIDELLARRDLARGGKFRADGVKIMQDGVCENHSAALLDPYLGGTSTGHSFVDRDMLGHVVPLLDAHGFQVHFHAVGDRAIRDALDSVSLARNANGRNDLRHQIAHVQVVHPSDVPRFHALDVIANIQARWAVNDPQMVDLTIPYLGPDRAGWQYPFRALRDAGTTLAGGSDWPVSDASPIQAMHVAVNRRVSDEDEAFLPGQAIRLDDALSAYTTGSAWANHLDAEAGSLELGKAADLVVLDRDPREEPVEGIGDTRVDLTVVDGRIVYQR